MEYNLTTLQPVLPEIFLLTAACLILVIDLFLSERTRLLTYGLALASLIGAVGLHVPAYLAMAGNVGNLPDVNNMDIQYAQSAILTPSDFSFPTNTIKTEATPNTEMVLIADLDIDQLKELHARGSVRNLRDRRKDLYKITRS